MRKRYEKSCGLDKRKIVRIVVIGTGSIGKRYIQGLSKLKNCSQFCIFDRNIEALQSVSSFLESCSIYLPDLHYLTEDELFKSIKSDTIVILSTTADRRMQTLTKVVDCRPFAILAEKPLVRSLRDYDEVLEKSADAAVPIYVNFLSHLLPVYQELAAEITEGEKIAISTSLPKDWGIACVGIHHFELFTWLSKSKEVVIEESNVNELFQQKRDGFSDIAGSVRFSSPEGSTLTVTSNETVNVSSVDIMFGNRFCCYFEQQEKVIQIRPNEDLCIKDVRAPLVSDYIANVISRIWDGEHSGYLPRAEHCYTAHKMLFEFLRTNKIGGLNFT